MDLDARITAFSELGLILSDLADGRINQYSSVFNRLVDRQQHLNPWFTPGNVRRAVSSIAAALNRTNLIQWTNSYNLSAKDPKPLTVGVIMAGNIPLVGFHDFLSVLISGHRIIVKASSRDSELPLFISEILCSIESRFSGRIDFTEGLMGGFDAVIATGSNNSSRYFNQYFGKYPNIIRKNRNSVAIISGDESSDELKALGNDVFSYFGLGCRNVSKLYLPAGYEPGTLTSYWEEYSDIVNHSRYANNYDYNKAIYLVNREPFHDSGFILLREAGDLSSPVSVLHYGFYNSLEELETELTGLSQSIQCIAGRGHLSFGTLQSPSLWDYADGIDTLDFLQKK